MVIDLAYVIRLWLMPMTVLPAGWVILSVPLRIFGSSVGGKPVVQGRGNYVALV